MKALLCVLLALAVFPVRAGAVSQDKSLLQNETRLLESELALAKKPNIYFIFDLQKSEVLLKSRGLVLRRMKVLDMKFWGNYSGPATRHLVRKSALFKEPKRVNIDPNKNKEEETEAPAPPSSGTFDIEALELKDMPTSYLLEFEGGIHISVRPEEEGFLTTLYTVSSSVGWYITRPILTIWNTFRGKPFVSIYLTFSDEDARSIYWSLVEKSENIIYRP